MNKLKFGLPIAFVLGTVSISCVKSSAMLKNTPVKTYARYNKHYKDLKNQLQSGSAIHGNFNAGGEIFTKEINLKTTKEGFTLPYIIHEGKDYYVTKRPDGTYVRLFDLDEVKKFMSSNDGDKALLAYDHLGRSRLTMVVSGDSGYVGMELDTGVWRHLLEDSRREFHLGQKVNLDKISIQTRNTINKALDDILGDANNIFLSN